MDSWQDPLAGPLQQGDSWQRRESQRWFAVGPRCMNHQPPTTTITALAACGGGISSEFCPAHHSLPPSSHHPIHHLPLPPSISTFCRDTLAFAITINYLLRPQRDFHAGSPSRGRILLLYPVIQTSSWSTVSPAHFFFCCLTTGRLRFLFQLYLFSPSLT